MGFQHWWLINHVLAKKFINPGGPPVFKLLFFLGGQRRLINPAGFTDPNLTYIYIYILVGGLEHCLFSPTRLGMMIQNLAFIFLKMVIAPPTRYLYIYIFICIYIYIILYNYI